MYLALYLTASVAGIFMSSGSRRFMDGQYAFAAVDLLLALGFTIVFNIRYAELERRLRNR